MTDMLTRSDQRQARARDKDFRREITSIAEWVGAQNARSDLGLPSEWDQANWVRESGVVTNGVAKFDCGTACCIAGRVGLLNGAEPAFMIGDGEKYRWSDLDEAQRAVAYVSDWDAFFPGRGLQSFETMGAHYLQLDEDEASVLFQGDNKYRDVMFLLGRLLRGEAITGYEVGDVSAVNIYDED